MTEGTGLAGRAGKVGIKKQFFPKLFNRRKNGCDRFGTSCILLIFLQFCTRRIARNIIKKMPLFLKTYPI